MGCSPSSARYAPGGVADDAVEATDLLAGQPAGRNRLQSKPPPPAQPKRTASSSPTPSAGSVEPVSPVESPSPERAAAAPGESPSCPARVRASPSRTPVGSSSRRRGSVPQLRLELGADTTLPEVENEGGSDEEDEEDYSPDEVAHFAKTLLGLDPEADADLLWIAEEALRAPLPVGWVELEDPKTGVPYFHSTIDNTVSWDHPLDGHYKLMAARAQLAKPGRKEELAQQAEPDEADEASATSTRDEPAAAEADDASDGDEMSPVAQRVRATSRDLSTLKQLFTDGLLDESVYQSKQEEVLRNCLSQLAPSETDSQPAAAKAADKWKKKTPALNRAKADAAQPQQEQQEQQTPERSQDKLEQPSSAAAGPTVASTEPAPPAPAAAAPPISVAAAVAAALRPNGEPPNALWLRLHEKVMAGPNRSAASVAEQAAAHSPSGLALGLGELPPVEELGAPRGRNPVKVRKTHLLRHFILQMITSPRQARDKHRGKLKSRCMFRRWPLLRCTACSRRAWSGSAGESERLPFGSMNDAEAGDWLTMRVLSTAPQTALQLPLSLSLSLVQLHGTVVPEGITCGGWSKQRVLRLRNSLALIAIEKPR
jgi:hypothetical protein